MAALHALDGPGYAICDPGHVAMVRDPVTLWGELGARWRCPLCASILDGQGQSLGIGYGAVDPVGHR